MRRCGEGVCRGKQVDGSSGQSNTSFLYNSSPHSSPPTQASPSSFSISPRSTPVTQSPPPGSTSSPSPRSLQNPRFPLFQYILYIKRIHV
ncbi:hypothetical protein E2C01_037053 [Portunus trituberculatus]|uniref:Uncharacterized protein n=1 Tax=Portunus trituberculatus TaxID=210409 RepID=A0A5B7FCY0_PORTR|nr:hypothetical protein [Portunus trituberculatus]